MKKLEIFSLHPVVSWQPPNPQNYNYFRFGAILLCIAKFLFFFLSGQIIFCSLMTNYNFTRRNFAYMAGESGLGLSGWIKPEQYHFNRSSASVLSRNCQKLKGEKKRVGNWRLFFHKRQKERHDWLLPTIRWKSFLELSIDCWQNIKNCLHKLLMMLNFKWMMCKYGVSSIRIFINLLGKLLFMFSSCTLGRSRLQRRFGIRHETRPKTKQSYHEGVRQVNVEKIQYKFTLIF